MSDAAATINELHRGTWDETLGLVLVSATRDAVRATVEIGPRHRQVLGIVHGGVYASIVETLASVGAALDAIPNGKNVVGLENHTSFIRAVREGTLEAIATPVTRGRRTQVWDVIVRNAEQAIVATGRVRLLVLEPDAQLAGADVTAKSE